MKTYLKESDILQILPELASVPVGWLSDDVKIFCEQNAFYLESEMTGNKALAFDFAHELEFWQGQLKQYGKNVKDW